jgi:uncharacterized protein YndB with AHSA1/START domain
MDIDVGRALGTVTRTVDEGHDEGVAVKIVRLERTYDTDVDDLWDACTNAERLPRWFLPVSGDLRPGGRFQIEGNAGGTVLTCEPPSHLVVTWEFAGDTSRVVLTLAAAGPERARLSLEHHVRESDHWREYGPGAVGIGWEQALLIGLDRHVPGGAVVDPAEAQAWTASEAGRSFTRASSDAWCDAAIAGGADPVWCRAAADRTTAAYLGDPAS